MAQRRGLTCRIVSGLVIGGAILLLAACGGWESDSESAPPTRTLPPVTDTPAPVLPEPTITPTDLPGASSLRATATPEADADGLGAALEGMLDRTLNDLTSQDINAEEIRLLALEQTEWTSASWGCDSGRDAPASALPVSGYRIIYSAGSEVYAYHTDAESSFFICEDVNWLTPRGTPLAPDPIAGSMVEMAQADLLARFDVTEEAIQLESLTSVTWPDASVGCPKPNALYDTRVTPGYRLVFQAGDETAIYHTSVRDVVYCTPEEEILPGMLREALATLAPES